MKSYRLQDFGSPLVPEETATPIPEGTEVLLRVTGTGICHSDLHIWEGGYHLGQGRTLLVKDRGVSLPLTMGHETAGEVIAAGEHGEGIRAGWRYLIYPWIGCGHCATCAEGNENLCASPRSLGIFRDGGYADYLIVPHPRYLLPLDGLDPVSSAPLACSGLTTFSALKKAGPRIRQEPIVIFGAGGLGLMSLALLKLLGGTGAVVVDIDENKRAAAEAAGALATVDGKAPNIVEQILAACGGSHRIAIDFVGSEDTAMAAFQCLPKGGKLISVGLFGGAAPWALPLIALRAITIQGSYVGNLSELAELLELIRQTPIPSFPITRVPMEQVNHVLGSLRLGQVIGRAVLTP